MDRLPIASAIALMLALRAGVALAQKTDSPARPELIVDIDVNDEVWLRNHNMTEADVNELVAKLKAKRLPDTADPLRLHRNPPLPHQALLSGRLTTPTTPGQIPSRRHQGHGSRNRHRNQVDAALWRSDRRLQSAGRLHRRRPRARNEGHLPGSTFSTMAGRAFIPSSSTSIPIASGSARTARPTSRD